MKAQLNMATPCGPSNGVYARQPDLEKCKLVGRVGPEVGKGKRVLRFRTSQPGLWEMTTVIQQTGLLKDGRNPGTKGEIPLYHRSSKGFPHSFQPSFFSKTGCFPWVFDDFLKRGILGKNGLEKWE